MTVLLVVWAILDPDFEYVEPIWLWLVITAVLSGVASVLGAETAKRGREAARHPGTPVRYAVALFFATLAWLAWSFAASVYFIGFAIVAVAFLGGFALVWLAARAAGASGPRSPLKNPATPGCGRGRFAGSPPEPSKILGGFPSDSCGARLGPRPPRSGRSFFNGLLDSRR